MKILEWWRRFKRRSERKNLRKLLVEPRARGWTTLVYVGRVLELFDSGRFERQYHQVDGELIRVELSSDPVALLTLTEELGLAVGQSATLPSTFVFNDRVTYDLDSWLTVDDSYYLRLTRWIPQLAEHVSEVQRHLKQAEICGDELVSYYNRKAGPLIKDLTNLALALLDLEEVYDQKAS